MLFYMRFATIYNYTIVISCIGNIPSFAGLIKNPNSNVMSTLFAKNPKSNLGAQNLNNLNSKKAVIHKLFNKSNLIPPKQPLIPRKKKVFDPMAFLRPKY